MMTLIRPLTEEDRPLIEGWISNEPAHQNNTFEFYAPKTPDGKPDKRIKSVIYEDEQGPVFAVRYSSALRIDMEFSNTANKERIRAVLTEGFPSVARQAREQGFVELIFDSVSQKLVAFCRAFGFRQTPETYRKVI